MEKKEQRRRKKNCIKSAGSKIFLRLSFKINGTKEKNDINNDDYNETNTPNDTSI